MLPCSFSALTAPALSLEQAGNGCGLMSELLSADTPRHRQAHKNLRVVARAGWRQRGHA